MNSSNMLAANKNIKNKDNQQDNRGISTLATDLLARPRQFLYAERYPVGQRAEQPRSFLSQSILSQNTTAQRTVSQNKLTRVTGVELNQTSDGLQVILKTAAGGERLVPLRRRPQAVEQSPRKLIGR